MQGMGVGPFTLSMAFRLTVMAVVVAAETIQKGEMAAIRSPPHKYSRILYEVSLEDENGMSSGLWKKIPLQDKDFKKKN